MWSHFIEIHYLLYQLVEYPRVRRCRSRQLSGNIEPSRCKFQKARASIPVCGPGVVVDVSAEFPGKYVELKVIKILKTVIYGIESLLYASLGLNGRGAKVAQLDLNAKGHHAGLKMRPYAVQVFKSNALMKNTLCSVYRIFDIVDQIVFFVRHGLKTFFNNQVDRPVVCINHL